MRKIERYPLEADGHEIFEAEDGEQGLASYQEHEPDCIVMGLTLSKMSGLELLRHLRASGTDVPVIVTTSDVQNATRALCNELGATTFLTKPFVDNELLACVDLGLTMREKGILTSQDSSHSVKILIVDDSKVTRELIKTSILGEPWEMREASGGSEALEMIEQCKPDIVLLDQQMPGLCGNDILRLLKKSDSTRDISVVMVTGASQDKMVEEALSLGAAEFIAKPFTKTVLTSRIQNVIRTRALLHEQRLLREAADDANHSKSRFLANITHELRSPLNSLLILSQMLAENKEGNLNTTEAEVAGVIHSGGKELLALINDLLDLSKAEEGKLEIHFDDVPIESIVDQLNAQFRPLEKQKGFEYIVKIDNNVPPAIFTNAQRLKQILCNLLSNAFKFTMRGSVTLNFSRPEQDVRFQQKRLTLENAIAVSVSDTGIGISLENRQLIFEAFEQADRTTSREFGGTGLGLSISRELAQLLGGEIHLASEEGQGSAFTLYLPLESSNREDTQDAPAELECALFMAT
jgi:signal transduction histidine kinase